MFDKLLTKTWKKICERYMGIPVLVVVYKPWKKDKNIFFQSIFPFDSDPYLAERFEQIAEHIRENHH